jgi:hypothetical protein
VQAFQVLQANKPGIVKTIELDSQAGFGNVVPGVLVEISI